MITESIGISKLIYQICILKLSDILQKKNIFVHKSLHRLHIPIPLVLNAKFHAIENVNVPCIVAMSTPDYADDANNI